jgi:hypothetical protein
MYSAFLGGVGALGDMCSLYWTIYDGCISRFDLGA